MNLEHKDELTVEKEGGTFDIWSQGETFVDTKKVKAAMKILDADVYIKDGVGHS